MAWWRQVLVLVASLAAGAPALAAAIDVPVGARALTLRAQPAGTEVKFVSKDPAFPFPAPGSDADPTATGLDVQVFTASGDAASSSATDGSGKPGWRLRADDTIYVYRAGAGAVPPGEIKKVHLKSGRAFRARGRIDLPLSGPADAVAIRVTMGSLRACALLSGASVRKNQPGRFVARDAPAPELADCADATLLGALGFDCASSSFPACGGACPDGGVCAPDPLGGPCRCNFETQACGDTAPSCNGSCPAGQRCWPIDGFIPGANDQCLCAPEETPPCGTTDLACGSGACPPGLVCEAHPGVGFYDPYCACVPPDQACGPGFGNCPPDMECLPISPADFTCVPFFCGGTFPTCGGSACGPGGACVPLAIGSSQYCVCASTSGSCDVPTCDGGLYCPPGEVCTSSGGTCGCQPG